MMQAQAGLGVADGGFSAQGGPTHPEGHKRACAPGSAERRVLAGFARRKTGGERLLMADY